jgi:hypothetical protein
MELLEQKLRDEMIETQQTIDDLIASYERKYENRQNQFFARIFNYRYRGMHRSIGLSLSYNQTMTNPHLSEQMPVGLQTGLRGCVVGILDSDQVGLSGICIGV